MKKYILSLCLLLSLTMPALAACSNSRIQTEKSSPSVQSPPSTAQTEITRRGGGGGRGGVGIAPRRPATDINRPRNRAPAAQPSPARGIGRGLFAFGLGALFASILNPFGFAHGFFFSLLGLLFWAIVLFALYRLFRNRFTKTRT